MNKIILDNESFINLNIDKDSIIEIDNKIIDTLNIKVNNAKVIINEYNELNKDNYIINIEQNNNSNVIYNHSFLNNNKYNITINIKLIGNNSKNVINIHGINDIGLSNIIVNGKVLKNTFDNELYENIKIMNIDNGKSIILPNMYIDTKNVIANHSTSVTNIDEDYLFYLNSKGIDKINSIKLIKEGFLNSIIKN